MKVETILRQAKELVGVEPEFLGYSEHNGDRCRKYRIGDKIFKLVYEREGSDYLCYHWKEVSNA